MFMLTVHMTITLLIEDSPYGFIAFMYANFPQRTCNPLRFRELGRRIPKAWEISAPLSVQRYKNEGK